VVLYFFADGVEPSLTFYALYTHVLMQALTGAGALLLCVQFEPYCIVCGVCQYYSLCVSHVCILVEVCPPHYTPHTAAPAPHNVVLFVGLVLMEWVAHGVLLLYVI